MSETRRTPLRPGMLAGLALLASVLLPDARLAAQTWRDMTASRRIESTEPVRVDVRYGAGRVRLSATDDPLVYRMNLRYDADRMEPLAEYTERRARLGVRSTGDRFPLGKSRDEAALTLALGRGVPLDLDLEFGAVRADIDLGGLSLRSLDLSTGASEARIDVSEPNPRTMDRATFEVGAADVTLAGLGNLGAERLDIEAGVGSVTVGLGGSWRRDATLSIEMGLGSLELRIPQGLGVRLRKESFLTSFDPQEMVRRGDAWYSLDWEEAERRVTIDLEAAFGSVTIVWMDQDR